MLSKVILTKILRSTATKPPSSTGTALNLIVTLEAARQARSPDGCNRLRPERAAEAVRLAYTLARQLLARQLRDPRHGDQSGWTFLLPTPDFVEKGLRELLRQRLAPIEVTNRGIQLVGSRMSLNPDLVFDRGRAVADVKYKLHDGTWNRPDLYQATTFATGYRTTHAAIICFDQRTGGTQASDIGIGDVALRTICWPCATQVSPVQAEDALVHACDAWLAHDIDTVH